MARLERRYQERQGAPLPKGLSEEEKINALGLGLSCPQPDANHPARWVRFLAPRPWMCG